MDPAERDALFAQQEREYNSEVHTRTGKDYIREAGLWRKAALPYVGKLTKREF